MSADHPIQRVVQAMLIQNRMHALLQTFRCAGGGKAEIEIHHAFARNDVARACARVDVRDLP